MYIVFSSMGICVSPRRHHRDMENIADVYKGLERKHPPSSRYTSCCCCRCCFYYFEVFETVYTCTNEFFVRVVEKS